MFTKKLAQVFGISLVSVSLAVAGGGYEENKDTMNGEDTDIEIETNQMQTRQNLRQGTAGFGPATFRDVVSGDAYNIYAGYQWQLTPYAALKGLVDATSDFDETVLAAVGVGGNLYPLNRDIAPYIGADVGVGYLQDPLQDSWAFNLGASVGAEIFRSSATAMNLEIGSRFHLQDFEEGDPFLYTARVGVLF